MPEKLGNGGHSYEKYDPNTGKYVADGQPNKYYDNPEEKNFANSSLKEKYKDFLNGIEENEELNALFGWKPKENKEYEKYSKPISEMTDPELSNEIKEHENWLEEYGINLKIKCFDQDLKLKCTNYREMHRLFDKYDFFKGINSDGSLRNPVKVDSWGMSRKHGYCSMFKPQTEGYGGYIYFCDKIRLNKNSFVSFEQTYNRQTRYIELNKRNNALDEKKVCYTFIHEFGHLLHAKFIQNEFKNEIQDFKKYDYYTFSEKYNKVLESSEKFAARARKETLKIFIDNGNEYSDFSLGNSEYSRKNNDEWFAETFASLEGGKPSKVALAFKEWLDKEITKLRGE